MAPLPPHFLHASFVAPKTTLFLSSATTLAITSLSSLIVIFMHINISMSLFICEKIEHPPIKPKKFTEDFVKILRIKFAEISSLLETFKIPNEIFDDFMRDLTRYDARPSDFREYLGTVEVCAKELDSAEELLKWIWDPEEPRHKRTNFFSYFLRYAETIKEKLIESYGYKNIKEGLQNHEDRIDDLVEMYKEENFDPQKIILNWMKVIELTENLKKEISYRNAKLSELFRRLRATREKELVPQTENVETLFHVSVNAQQIYETGFNPEGPKSDEGLGGAKGDKSNKPSISFTSNFYVAKEINRCLKEAIMISKGELKLKDIVQMADEHDIDLPKVMGAEWKELQGKKESVSTFEAYRQFLQYSESLGKRYNPLFFGNVEQFVEMFATKNVDNVGILVCKVDMTNKDIDYLNSMFEYRVPPSAVIEIENLLK
jgi:hypothetical protein